MEAYLINLLLYNAFLVPVIFFSVLYYMLAFTSFFVKAPRYSFPDVKDGQLPNVTIQIPVYNDPVAIRCIKKCLNFNYPKNKYHIIVADDSNDGITPKILDGFVKAKRNVRIVRRATRKGFKSGALNNTLKHCKGDIIVIFDSDFVPKKDFLRKLVTPFIFDKELAIVQSRMSFVNYGQNIISKFAAALLIVYHQCIMPLQNKTKTVFFCGTGGAIKKDVLLSVGGWNEKSVTEDADLSLLIMEKGYKNLYISNLEVAGEVPFTLRSFLRQQMRWAYGLTRVFMDHWKKILFSPSFTAPQRAMMIFMTTGYVITPFVLGAAITGQLGWIITPPKPLLLSDLINFLKMLLLSSGFVALGVMGLHRAGKSRDILKLYIAAFTVGIILSAANFVAFARSVLNMRAGWIRTPKMGSSFIIEFFKNAFRRKNNK